MIAEHFILKTLFLLIVLFVGLRDFPNKQLLTIACIVGIFSGCNYLRTFPLYSEVYIEQPQKIQLFTPGLINAVSAYPKTENAKVYFRIKERISNYLDKNSNLDANILAALKNSEVILGMSEEQVVLVVGQPTKKISLGGNSDLWIYKGDRSKVDERVWYFKWGKLRFENNILKEIKVQHINISK